MRLNHDKLKKKQQPKKKYWVILKVRWTAMVKARAAVIIHPNRNHQMKAEPVPNAGVLGRPSRLSSWRSSRMPSRKRPSRLATSESSWPKKPDYPWESFKSVTLGLSFVLASYFILNSDWTSDNGAANLLHLGNWYEIKVKLVADT